LIHNYSHFRSLKHLLCAWVGLLILGTYCQSGYGGVSAGDKQAIEIEIISDNYRNERLDLMFSRLKAAEDETTARVIENEIWAVWFKSNNKVVSSLMQEIMSARSHGKFEHAIELLDILVSQYPEYSEGWNQRATVYYMIGNYEASLKDVMETLAREPRHFGALAGRAAIYWMQGDQELARESLRDAVQIHPYLRDQKMLSQ
jgi:tetratricopeptide (TPR) repeat protein